MELIGFIKVWCIFLYSLPKSISNMQWIVGMPHKMRNTKQWKLNRPGRSFFLSCFEWKDQSSANTCYKILQNALVFAFIQIDLNKVP